jgi:hypothetical protein
MPRHALYLDFSTQLFLSAFGQRRETIEQLQNNLKEEYRAVFDFEVALFQTVSSPLTVTRSLLVSTCAVHSHKLMYQSC